MITRDEKHFLPSHSSRQEKDISKTLSRISGVPVPTGDLWNPDTCPVEMLPYLAWALSVDVWRDGWRESVKRSVVREAIYNNWIKGTKKSVVDAVNTMGGNASIVEWWEAKGKNDDPYSFDIYLSVLGDVSGDINYQKDLEAAINMAKPARCQYTITLGLPSIGKIPKTRNGAVVGHRRLKFTAKCPKGFSTNDI